MVGRNGYDVGVYFVDGFFFGCCIFFFDDVLYIVGGIVDDVFVIGWVGQVDCENGEGFFVGLQQVFEGFDLGQWYIVIEYQCLVVVVQCWNGLCYGVVGVELWFLLGL